MIFQDNRRLSVGKCLGYWKTYKISEFLLLRHRSKQRISQFNFTSETIKKYENYQPIHKITDLMLNVQLL